MLKTVTPLVAAALALCGQAAHAQVADTTTTTTTSPDAATTTTTTTDNSTGASATTMTDNTTGASSTTVTHDPFLGVSSSFRGFRAEIQGGGDRFHSQGTHDSKISYGAAVGFDGVINDAIVVGPEFTYWRGRTQNVTAGTGAGIVAHKGFEEFGAAVRLGYLVTPQVLVYAAGGYASNEQRKLYTGPTGTGAGGFYNHTSTDGYQVGGGVEFSLTDMFYVGAGYRYSNYDNHTARERLFASAGVRFK